MYQQDNKASDILGEVWSFCDTASMYLEKRSPIIRKCWKPLLVLSIYELSSAKNCIGASGFIMGSKGALSGIVSHLVYLTVNAISNKGFDMSVCFWPKGTICKKSICFLYAKIC